jgi:methyltransferase (TIGR00027 family)
MIGEGDISSVADTALWVATLRGQEGGRRDAAFHDPLATLLAGPRGRKIAASMPRSAVVAWSMVVRTSAIDQLINEALATGIDCVVNLGAGLDTRPYRMDLPPCVRWIEIDFPHIVEFKNSALLEHKPACRVERVGLNLLDRPTRNGLLEGFGSETKNALLIAEGVIPYFSNDDVASLAGDLHAIPSFRNWILDFDNAGKRRMPREWEKRLRAAPFLFEVADWFGFFRQFGWHPCKVINSAEQSEKIKRPYPFAFPLGLLMYVLPATVRRKILSLSGAVSLQNIQPEATQ